MSFPFQQSLYAYADFVLAAEAGAEFLAVEVLERLSVVRLGERHIAHFLDQFRRVLQVEVHELLDLGLGQRLLGHVDEDRARQRW